MTEDWPVRPASRLFYAREKAELERFARPRRLGNRDWISTCYAAPRLCSGRTRSGPRAAWPARWLGPKSSRHPAVMDTAKAKRDLGWQPRYTGLDALRATVRGDRN
jgi:nucleoside-diphosphate-sugar epimerase